MFSDSAERGCQLVYIKGLYLGIVQLYKDFLNYVSQLETAWNFCKILFRVHVILSVLKCLFISQMLTSDQVADCVVFALSAQPNMEVCLHLWTYYTDHEYWRYK